MRRRLIAFFRNKSKRRHQIVENAHRLTLNVVDQRSKINQIRFGLQHCDEVIPENSTFHGSLKQTIMPSDTDIGVVDVLNETVAHHEVVREPGWIN